MHIENCYLRHGVGSHRQFRPKNLVKILVAWKIMLARVRNCPDITTFKSPFVYKSYLWMGTDHIHDLSVEVSHEFFHCLGIIHVVNHMGSVMGSVMGSIQKVDALKF